MRRSRVGPESTPPPGGGGRPPRRRRSPSRRSWCWPASRPRGRCSPSRWRSRCRSAGAGACALAAAVRGAHRGAGLGPSRRRRRRPGARASARSSPTGLAVGAGHQAQERDAARMASLSLTDRLTGVHNYAFFADALPRECRRAERYGLPLSLVVLDLDRFKAFNDRYGHDAGNRLLAAVGEAIRDELPRLGHRRALRRGGVRAHRPGAGDGGARGGRADPLRRRPRARARRGRRGGRHDDLGGGGRLPHGSDDDGDPPARAGRQGALPLEGDRPGPGQPVRPRAALGRRVLEGPRALGVGRRAAG